MFETIEIGDLGLERLAVLREVCETMARADVAAHHRGDYEALAARIRTQEARLHAERERAATVIQAAARGALARAELQRQTHAALVIQSVFRGHQTRKANVLGLLREQRDREEERLREERLRAEAEERARVEAERQRVEQQRLGAAGRAQAQRVQQELAPAFRFTPQMPAPPAPALAEERLALLGRLEEEYRSFDTTYQGLRSRDRQNGAGRQLGQKVEAARRHLDAELALMTAEIRAAMSQHQAALMVQLPGDFRISGEPVACGGFFYPGAGYLVVGGDAQGRGARHVTFHGNRSLVHVRDEVTPQGTLALAQAYLDDCLRAVREVVAKPKASRVGTHTIRGATGPGGQVEWRIIYQLLGTEEQIIHIDSGYEWSRWREPAMRGICPRCGVRQRSGTHRTGTSGERSCKPSA